MKPAERIVLVKKLAQKLADVGEFSEIDLTLRVFELPWTDMWETPSNMSEEKQ